MVYPGDVMLRTTPKSANKETEVILVVKAVAYNTRYEW